MGDRPPLIEDVAAFDSLCQALEENQPDVTILDLNNVLVDSAPRPEGPLFGIPQRITDEQLTRVGRALHGNTFIQVLQINVTNLAGAGTREIARFIASSPRISRLYIISDHHPLVGVNSGSEAAENELLEAASTNDRIHTLSLSESVRSVSLANCLPRMRNSLVTLELSVKNIFLANTAAGQYPAEEAETFGLAVASLEALKELAVSCSCDFVVASFLNNLGPLLPKLQKLMISAQPQFEFEPDSQFIEALQWALRLATRLDTLFFDLHRNPDFTDWWDSTELLTNTTVQLIARHPSIRVFHSNIVFEGEHAHVVDLIEHNNPMLQEMQIMSKDMTCVRQVVNALKNNTTVQRLEVELSNEDDGEGEGEDEERPVIDDDTKQEIAFYTTRNEFTPALDVATKFEMVTLFETLSRTRSEALSVIFEILRVRDNWYE